MEMSGTSLDLTHTPEGNVLVVRRHRDRADARPRPGPPAGPVAPGAGDNIDQVNNEVTVDGLGSMRMTTQTDFEGKKLAVPSNLMIYWKQSMHFKGQFAQFHGHVEARQESKSLLCENMQVYLNRPVSLTQQAAGGKAPGDAAAVDRVVCDSSSAAQGVTITDSERDGVGRLVAYRRVEASEVVLYKEEGRVVARVQPGQHGLVRIQQRGPKGDPSAGLAPPPPGRGQPQRGPTRRGPAPPPEEEDKLTWVRFDNQMRVNNTPANTLVHFYGNVEVVHLPADEPSLREQTNMDSVINKLPARALYLRRDQLDVKSSKDAEGHARQEMRAAGRASVQWHNEFFGTARRRDHLRRGQADGDADRQPRQPSAGGQVERRPERHGPDPAGGADLLQPPDRCTGFGQDLLRRPVSGGVRLPVLGPGLDHDGDDQPVAVVLGQVAGDDGEELVVAGQVGDLADERGFARPGGARCRPSSLANTVMSAVASSTSLNDSFWPTLRARLSVCPSR